MFSSSQIAFVVLASLAIAGSMGVVLFNQPVRAALSLVLNFFVLGLLYFTLGAELLGITQIMVYAGAIMVLFLFVVMMLRQADQKLGMAQLDWRFPVAMVVSFGLATAVLATVIRPLGLESDQQPRMGFGSPQSLGFSLFAQYAWPFEVVSFLLLVGIVGAILLAKRKM